MLRKVIAAEAVPDGCKIRLSDTWTVRRWASFVDRRPSLARRLFRFSVVFGPPTIVLVVG